MIDRSIPADNLLSFVREQERSLTQFFAPISATAGAGKTRMITGALHGIVTEGLIPADRIICTTFTRAAAAELRARAMGSGNKNKLAKVSFMTLDSLAMSILKTMAPLVGCTSPDGGFISSNSLEEIRLDNSLTVEMIRKFIPEAGESLLSSFRDMMNEDWKGQNPYHPVRDKNFINTDKSEEDFTERSHNFHAIEAIMKFIYRQGNPAVAGLPKLLIIDEAQDTSLEQMILVLILMNAGASVILVGDPLQTLYHWRGAVGHRVFDENIIRGPVSDMGGKLLFPNCNLSVNYRCASSIVKTASDFARNIPLIEGPGAFKDSKNVVYGDPVEGKEQGRLFIYRMQPDTKGKSLPFKGSKLKNALHNSDFFAHVDGLFDAASRNATVGFLSTGNFKPQDIKALRAAFGDHYGDRVTTRLYSATESLLTPRSCVGIVPGKRGGTQSSFGVPLSYILQAFFMQFFLTIVLRDSSGNPLPSRINMGRSIEEISRPISAKIRFMLEDGSDKEKALFPEKVFSDRSGLIRALTDLTVEGMKNIAINIGSLKLSPMSLLQELDHASYQKSEMARIMKGIYQVHVDTRVPHSTISYFMKYFDEMADLETPIVFDVLQNTPLNGSHAKLSTIHNRSLRDNQEDHDAFEEPTSILAAKWEGVLRRILKEVKKASIAAGIVGPEETRKQIRNLWTGLNAKKTTERSKPVIGTTIRMNNKMFFEFLHERPSIAMTGANLFSSGEFKPIQGEIALTTIFQSKGLELDHIVIVECVGRARENETPAERARALRNILYVAMTRAKKSVTLLLSDATWAKIAKLEKGNAPAGDRHKDAYIFAELAIHMKRNGALFRPEDVLEGGDILANHHSVAEITQSAYEINAGCQYSLRLAEKPGVVPPMSQSYQRFAHKTMAEICLELAGNRKSAFPSQDPVRAIAMALAQAKSLKTANEVAKHLIQVEGYIRNHIRESFYNTMDMADPDSQMIWVAHVAFILRHHIAFAWSCSENMRKISKGDYVRAEYPLRTIFDEESGDVFHAIPDLFRISSEGIELTDWKFYPEDLSPAHAGAALDQMANYEVALLRHKDVPSAPFKTEVVMIPVPQIPDPENMPSTQTDPEIPVFMNKDLSAGFDGWSMIPHKEWHFVGWRRSGVIEDNGFHENLIIHRNFLSADTKELARESMKCQSVITKTAPDSSICAICDRRIHCDNRNTFKITKED